MARKVVDDQVKVAGWVRFSNRFEQSQVAFGVARGGGERESLAVSPPQRAVDRNFLGTSAILQGRLDAVSVRRPARYGGSPAPTHLSRWSPCPRAAWCIARRPSSFWGEFWVLAFAPGSLIAPTYSCAERYAPHLASPDGDPMRLGGGGEGVQRRMGLLLLIPGLQLATGFAGQPTGWVSANQRDDL